MRITWILKSYVVLCGHNAKIEMACDSIRAQGRALNTCLGITQGKVRSVSENDGAIAQALMTDVPERRSTIVMRTNPFPPDLLKGLNPHHQAILFTKSQRPGCHQWRLVNIGLPVSLGRT